MATAGGFPFDVILDSQNLLSTPVMELKDGKKTSIPLKSQMPAATIVVPGVKQSYLVVPMAGTLPSALYLLQVGGAGGRRQGRATLPCSGLRDEARLGVGWWLPPEHPPPAPSSPPADGPGPHHWRAVVHAERQGAPRCSPTHAVNWLLRRVARECPVMPPQPAAPRQLLLPGHGSPRPSRPPGARRHQPRHLLHVWRLCHALGLGPGV